MVEEVKVSPEYNIVRFEDSDTIYTCSDPKSDPTGLLPNLTSLTQTNPKPTIPKRRQLCNIGYCDDRI
jgi:hypothetical protein